MKCCSDWQWQPRSLEEGYRTSHNFAMQETEIERNWTIQGVPIQSRISEIPKFCSMRSRTSALLNNWSLFTVSIALLLTKHKLNIPLFFSLTSIRSSSWLRLALRFVGRLSKQSYKSLRTTSLVRLNSEERAMFQNYTTSLWDGNTIGEIFRRQNCSPKIKNGSPKMKHICFTKIARFAIPNFVFPCFLFRFPQTQITLRQIIQFLSTFYVHAIPLHKFYLSSYVMESWNLANYITTNNSILVQFLCSSNPVPMESRNLFRVFTVSIIHFDQQIYFCQGFRSVQKFSTHNFGPTFMSNSNVFYSMYLYFLYYIAINSPIYVRTLLFLYNRNSPHSTTTTFPVV